MPSFTAPPFSPQLSGARTNNRGNEMSRNSFGGVNIVVNQIAGGKRWSPLIATCLSIIPGLGQLYKGQLFRGLIWFVAVLAGYALIVPGLVLHLCCAFNAATSEP